VQILDAESADVVGAIVGSGFNQSRSGSAQLDTLSKTPASEPAQQTLLGRRQCQEVDFVQQAFLARTARLVNSSRWNSVLKTNGAEPAASAHGLEALRVSRIAPAGDERRVLQCLDLPTRLLTPACPPRMTC